MQYKVWDGGVIRDATPEEIEQMEHIPKPFDETNNPVPTPEEPEELPDLINDVSGIMEL